jgi:hypothetical protein
MNRRPIKVGMVSNIVSEMEMLTNRSGNFCYAEFFINSGSISVLMRAVKRFNGNGSFVNSKVGMGMFSVNSGFEARCDINQRVTSIVEFATKLMWEKFNVRWAFGNMGRVMNAQSISNGSASEIRMKSEEFNMNPTSKTILNGTV